MHRSSVLNPSLKESCASGEGRTDAFVYPGILDPYKVGKLALIEWMELWRFSKLEELVRGKVEMGFSAFNSCPR